MTEPQNDDDETKFNETLKRMLKTPPKPHNESKTEKKNPGQGLVKEPDPRTVKHMAGVVKHSSQKKDPA